MINIPRLKAISLALLLMLPLCYWTLTAPARADTAAYRLSKTIKLNGNGSWDYLISDSSMRRLYVTHYDKVTVLDIDTGRIVGEISGMQGVHGVAIDHDSGRGFASNGKSDSITIFDLQSLGVIGQAATGRNPDAIIYEPVSRRVFSFNHSGGDVTVINAADGGPVGTITVGGELEYADSDDAGNLFVNVEDRSEIARISRDLEVTARWPLAPCEEPTGLALDKQNHRLFSACGNGMLLVVDADDGHIVGNIAIGKGCDGVRFDPKTGLIFTSNGEGTLSVIQQDSADAYRLVDSMPTRRGARTLEIDLPTHKVFTATAELGPVPEARPGERARPEILPNSFVVLEYSVTP